MKGVIFYQDTSTREIETVELYDKKFLPECRDWVASTNLIGCPTISAQPVRYAGGTGHLICCAHPGDHPEMLLNTIATSMLMASAIRDLVEEAEASPRQKIKSPLHVMHMSKIYGNVLLLPPSVVVP